MRGEQGRASRQCSDFRLVRSSRVLIFLDQSHCDIRGHARVAGIDGEFNAEDCLAGAGIVGDPNRAVIQDPSTPLGELVGLSLLAAFAVCVDQRGQDAYVRRQESLGHGAERVLANSLVPQKDADIG